jgi:hypothetical protein
MADIETMPLPPTFTPLRNATYVIDAHVHDDWLLTDAAGDHGI